MLALSLCFPTPAGVRSSGLVVFVVLSVLGELSLCSCGTADSSVGNETADLNRRNLTADQSQGNKTADQSQVNQTADETQENETSNLSRGNQPADKIRGNGTADNNRENQSADRSRGNETVSTVSNEFGNITWRSAVKTFMDVKVAEKRLKELTDRLNLLRKELEKRKLPGKIPETFIDINTLLDDIFNLMRKIPKRMMDRLKRLKEGAEALKVEARKKLFVPMNDQIDSLLGKLKTLLESVERKDRKKVRVFMYKLERLRRDLPRLETNNDLYILKRQVEELARGIKKLKTAKKDEKIVKDVERSTKWLSSGVSYYIVRYSVWLAPTRDITVLLTNCK